MRRQWRPRQSRISLDKVWRGGGGIVGGGPWRDEGRGEEEECQYRFGRRRSANVDVPGGAVTNADMGHDDGNSYGHRRFERLVREEDKKGKPAAVSSAATATAD